MSTILLEHFYHINTIKTEKGTISAQVTFHVNHPIFKGHFPDMPIVPGVCQTQMLGEIFGEALCKTMRLRNAASIKFLSPVDPNKNPTLDLTISYTIMEDHSYSVSAQYVAHEIVFFKFKGVYIVA